MIKKKTVNDIEKLINKKILFCKLLSDSFGINCVRVTTQENKLYIVKYYKNKNNKFNAIQAEYKNLLYFNKLNLNFFPKVIFCDNNFLIIEFFNSNNLQPSYTKKDFLKALIKLHSIKRGRYGFNFDTQIGGLKQINKKSINWVKFYREYRLGYIFELINFTQPMSTETNKKISFLLNNLENYIPHDPKPRLLHGDLWEGNILFKSCKFIGFIDPGSFYGHNEMEIAYLTWFNPRFIDKNFLDKYNDRIKISNEYKNYEVIYQLYYSLLNVYLWDRSYVKNVSKLLNKLKL